MDLNINGRRALVTGASTGIGAGVAIALAREGVLLALSAQQVWRRSPKTATAIEAEGFEKTDAYPSLTNRCCRYHSAFTRGNERPWPYRYPCKLCRWFTPYPP